MKEKQNFISESHKQAYEKGFTEGMNLVKGTFEANRQEWETQARKDAIKVIVDWLDSFRHLFVNLEGESVEIITINELKQKLEKLLEK